MAKMKYAWLAAALTALLLLVYYWHSILNADSVAYAIYGDGYKNYYTLTYYLQNDKGAHFSGMNYPYGENVLFTDNQPAMAWLLKAITYAYPGIALHVHGFTVYAAFLSIVIAAFFIMLILLEYNVHKWYGIVFTALIALLTPQLIRLLGHFSLTYSCYVPVLIYLLVKYFKGDKPNRYLLLLTLWTTFFSFVHLYFMAMGSLFVMLATAGAFVTNIKNLSQKFPFIAKLAIAGIIPFTVLKTYLFITDPVKDRPGVPYGFLEYNSTIYDIISHSSSFTGKIVCYLLPADIIKYSSEGMGYIGFIPVLCMVVAPFILLQGLFKRRNFFEHLRPMPIFLAAALIVLLLAMAFPLSLHKLSKYYQFLPSAVKQFRALGRLSWVFYFTSAIFAVLMLSQMYNRLRAKNKIFAHALNIVVIAVWFVDVNMVSVDYARRLKYEAAAINEAAERQELLGNLKKAGKSSDSFQAIIPIPLFLNGSEKLYLESDLNLPAMKASLYTGLPLVCGQMSRTSEQQTFKIARLLSDDYLVKDILQKYPNEKPLLLMYLSGEHNPVTEQLLSKAVFLFNINSINYYELPLSAFKDKRNEAREYYALNKARIFNHGGGVFSTDSINRTLYLSFDSMPFKDAAFGKGAHDPGVSNTCLYFDTIPNGMAGVTYILSAWAYSDSRRSAFTETYITQVDTAGKDIAYYNKCAKFSNNTYGKWVMCQVTFTLSHAKNKIYVATEEGYNTYDELMIRPLNDTVITQLENDSLFMFNNYPIR